MWCICHSRSVGLKLYGRHASAALEDRKVALSVAAKMRWLLMILVCDSSCVQLRAEGLRPRGGKNLDETYVR
jgi:hypothetical protein